ncbi:MAG: SDR family NAD(P)-dependent oxidoreductase [Bacteroidetes bacterium]|nr:SDR family NAD(P)-dependent oxidoreductase [Bacteroidota bacterium]
MLKEKSRILVTGACGSIGSKMVERLLADGHTVCAFDQSEDGLFKLDQIFNPIYGGNLKLFIGSVRDYDRLNRAFEGVDVVFHCAALKHVYLSEYNPFEAMQTNIFGVNNVINAAIKANADRVVFTSSDKAVNPSSTMGATKLLGERLMTAANHYMGKHKTRFASVRFGNVLNTNGSVLHIFKKQIDNNLPLTITSEDMSRFFISMDQALDLCLHAVNEMTGGEIYVSSMGCCKIMSLAKSVSNYGKFDYKIIGQKPGEKLYEELVTDVEAQRTVIKDGYYIILPDTIDMMPHTIQDTYNKEYQKLPRLENPLRSDQNMLNDADVLSMLKSIGLHGQN